MKASYKDQHTAPGHDDSPLHDLTAQGTFPHDIYSHKAAHLYGHGDAKMDAHSIKIIHSAKGNADAKVRMYRAVPAHVNSINHGDWVTINPQYAKNHGEARLGEGNYKVLHMDVPAKHLFNHGDIHEWGYNPHEPMKKSEGMNSQIFIAVDGDAAGQMVGRAILANDVAALHDASERINHGQDVIRDWAQVNGGMLISAGGDEGTLSVPTEALHLIEQLRADYVHAIGLTLTCGVGSTLSEAGKALMVGKLRGKNQVCQYDQTVEQDYAAAQQAAEDGTATGEGKKLGDAYMKPIKESEDTHADCQYCAELAGDNMQDEEHCQYCHNNVSEDQTVAHCQYCAESEQAQAQHDPNAEGHADDCEYCQAATQNAQQDHEHSGDDCVYCQQASNNATPDHEHSGDDCQYCAAAQSNVATDGQDLQQIAQEIEQSTSGEQGPQDVLSDMESQDGTSHPDGFQQNVPGSMGLAEDEETAPDLTQVLSSGLDAHQDNIQRERVVQMVSEALQGFKSCKDILERAQQQAPQLYESSIAMLRAMIEMAKMLGLKPENQDAVPQDDSNPQDPQSNPQEQQPEGKLQGR